MSPHRAPKPAHKRRDKTKGKSAYVGGRKLGTRLALKHPRHRISAAAAIKDNA